MKASLNKRTTVATNVEHWIWLDVDVCNSSQKYSGTEKL